MQKNVLCKPEKIAIILAIALITIQTALAGTGWQDDFNEEASQEWHIKSTGINNTNNISNGEYHLGTKSNNTEKAIIISYVNKTYQDKIITASIEKIIGEEITASIIGRLNPEALEGYALSINLNESKTYLRIERITSETHSVKAETEILLENANNITLKFALLDTKLYGKAWKTNETEPENWHVNATTQITTQGTAGIGTYTSPDKGITEAKTIFTNTSLASTNKDKIYVDKEWKDKEEGEEIGQGKIYSYNAYSKIQDAINAASTQAEIKISKGTYYETLSINKAITLTGENKETTIVSGNNTETTLIEIRSDNTTVQGITAKNTIGTNTKGIKIKDSNNAHLKNITIKNVYGEETANGVKITNSSNTHLESIEIRNVTSQTSKGNGIKIKDEQSGKEGTKITNTTITNINTGIYLSDTARASKTSMHNSKITNYTARAAINNDQNTFFNAAQNWWGTPMPNWENITKGRIIRHPWNTDEEQTLLVTSEEILAQKTWLEPKKGGTSRAAHTATLHEGKIYFWGGDDENWERLNTIDIYDTETDTWSNGTSGGARRYFHTANEYNNKIYIWGGWADEESGITNKLDIYNIETDMWSNGTSGGTPRELHSSAEHNGKIYYWGGWTNQGITNTLDIYDISTNTWSNGTAYGTHRHSHTATLHEDKIYIWGGYEWHFSANITNKMYIYDISTDTWSNGTSGGTPRAGHTSALYNNKIYYWGGEDKEMNVLNTIDIYNTETDTWSTGIPGKNNVYYLEAIIHEGKMYSWGGWDFNADWDVTNRLEIYDIEKEQEIKEAIKKINSGTAKIEDYEKAAIENAVEENKAIYDATISIVKDLEGSSLAHEKIQQIVTQANLAASHNAKSIISFNIESGTTTIDEAKKEIIVTMPTGASLESLTPTIIFIGDKISPESGAPQDFTNPKKYTVTATDGTTQEYIVTVNIKSEETTEEPAETVIVRRSPATQRMPLEPQEQACTTTWTCTEWNECENRMQTRTCTYPENTCEPITPKPRETQTCVEHPESISEEKPREIRPILFDINLQVLERIIRTGENLNVVLGLINLGIPGRVNTHITYTIRDRYGETILEKQEMIPIETQGEFIKSIDTKHLKPGTYSIIADLSYEGQTEPAQAERIFTVEEIRKGIKITMKTIIAITILLIATITILVARIKIKRS